MDPAQKKIPPNPSDGAFRSVPAHNLVRILSGEMPVPAQQRARPATDAMWDNLDGPAPAPRAKAPARKKRRWFF